MNLENIQVKVDKPYPEIVNAKEDFHTVAILKNLANDRNSELKAILQYTYQSVISDKIDEEIAMIFEEIGIVEMTHLDMLMHAIVDFGGNPKYEDAHGMMFSTSAINYSTKLSEMLENNIRGEQMAIEAYSSAISKVQNESLKQLFARIIEDEQRHIEIFKDIRRTVEFLSI